MKAEIIKTINISLKNKEQRTINNIEGCSIYFDSKLLQESMEKPVDLFRGLVKNKYYYPQSTSSEHVVLKIIKDHMLRVYFRKWYRKASVESRKLFKKKYLIHNECRLLPKNPRMNFFKGIISNKGIYWFYRGCVVRVDGHFHLNDERALLVREIVMKREERFDRLTKLVDLEDRIKNASRRELISDKVKMFV